MLKIMQAFKESLCDKACVITKIRPKLIAKTIRSIIKSGKKMIKEAKKITMYVFRPVIIIFFQLFFHSINFASGLNILRFAHSA